MPARDKNLIREGSFFYMGAETFNELTLTARMSDNVFAFREIMNYIYV